MNSSPPNPHLRALQSYFHQLFVSHYAAKVGIACIAKRMRQQGARRNNNLFIGSGPPTQGGPVHASVQNSFILDGDELCLDVLAKGIVSITFGYWEKITRSAIAADQGVKSERVSCDLMGDLRLIRNCVLHNDSIISDQGAKMKELAWRLPPGKLTITDKMFTDLSRQMNEISVRVDTTAADDQ